MEILFKSYSEPDLVEQLIGTKVLILENKKTGSYLFETTDGQENILFKANGVIHKFIPNLKITRTFEMENTPFGVQFEFYQFEKINSTKS